MLYFFIWCPLLLAYAAEVLSLGGACADLLVHVPESFLVEHQIEKGGSSQIDVGSFNQLRKDLGSFPIEIHPGGSACNTIRGLSHLHHKTAFVAKIGDDDLGLVFTKALIHNKVDFHLLLSDKPTMQVLSLITPDGDRTMRCLPGATNDLKADDINPCLFDEIRHLHLEGYALYDLEMVERAMKMAKDQGANISFDLSSFEIIRKHRDALHYLLPKYVDIVFCNEQEAYEIVQEYELEAAIALAKICKIAVVAAGEKGAYLAYENKAVHIPTFPIPIVDATGAGDLFAAGFIHGYLSGVPLEKAVFWGHLTGGEVIQVIGAEIPDERWNKILNQMK